MSLNQIQWPDGEHPSGLSPPIRPSYRIAPVDGRIHTNITDKDPPASKLLDSNRSKLISVEFEWTREQFVIFEEFYRLTLKNGAYPFRFPVWEERGTFVYSCFFASAYTAVPNRFGWSVSFTLEADPTYGVHSAEAEASIARFNTFLQPLEFNEVEAIKKFIDSQVANGNWDLIHEFWVFPLKNINAALVGLKTGRLMVLSPSGASLTHTPLIGFTHNSGSSGKLTADWNVIDDGSSDYDFLIGAYVTANNDVGVNNVTIFGHQSTGSLSKVTLGPRASFVEGYMGTRSDFSPAPNQVVTSQPDIVAGNFYSLSRIGNTQYVYSDATLLGSAVESNLGILHTRPFGLFGSLTSWNPTTKISTDLDRWAGSLSSFVIAKPTLDLDNFTENEQYLRTSLSGHTNEAIQVRLLLGTGLRNNEVEPVMDFVDSNVASGNWEKVKEFYLFALGRETSGGITGFKGKKAKLHGFVNELLHVDHEGFRSVANQYTDTGGFIDTQYYPHLEGRLGREYGCYVSRVTAPLNFTINIQKSDGFLFGVSRKEWGSPVQKRDAVALSLVTSGTADWPTGLRGVAYSDSLNAAVDSGETVYQAGVQYSVEREVAPLGDTVLYKDNVVQAASFEANNPREVDQSIYVLAYNTQTPGDDVNFPKASEWTSCTIAAWWALDTSGTFDRASWKTAVDTLMSALGVP